MYACMNEHMYVYTYIDVYVCKGERRDAYRVLLGKPEGKRPLGRLRHRWEDNIKMDLKEVGWGDIDWND
jgi:hypothetical protein